MGLTGCKCGGERVESGVLSVLCDVSKCVLEKLTVKLQIAIASRQKVLSKIQKV